MIHMFYDCGPFQKLESKLNKLRSYKVIQTQFVKAVFWTLIVQ